MFLALKLLFKIAFLGNQIPFVFSEARGLNVSIQPISVL